MRALWEEELAAGPSSAELVAEIERQCFAGPPVGELPRPCEPWEPLSETLLERAAVSFQRWLS